MIEESAQKARDLARRRQAEATPVRAALPPAPAAAAAAAAAASPAGDRQDERQRLDRIERCRKASGVPRRYQQARLDDFARVPAECREAYAAVARALARYTQLKGIVALLGRRGTGKTRLACALVNAYCAAGRSARYADVMDYALAVQRTYSPQASKTAEDVERDFVKPELLVLDAMEDRADTDWNDRMLTRLVNKRYEQELVTVLISNEEVEPFNARVGATIADRIKDDQGGLIRFTWPSLRGRIQEDH